MQTKVKNIANNKKQKWADLYKREIFAQKKISKYRVSNKIAPKVKKR